MTKTQTIAAVLGVALASAGLSVAQKNAPQKSVAQGGASATAAAQNPLRHRWVYLSPNLQVDESLKTVQAVMRRAKAAGYNGVMLADYKLQILDSVPDKYFQNARAFKQTAQELGLSIIPTVAPVGYSNGLLSHDPNLAEGLPVRDALFVVENGQAELQPDPAVRLQNGGFEEARGDELAGWQLQDATGEGTFVDKEVKHGGAQSLRIENIGKANPRTGNGRVMQKIAVAPWRQYHISVWLKTENFETPGDIRGLALSPGGRSLTHGRWEIEKTQDWKQYHAVFNSLDNREMQFYFGVWEGRGGKLWWDDAQVEEVGLLNVLRRPGCPFTARGENGTTYQEGRDFEPVRDPKLGTVPWPGEYEIYHQPPPIRLTPGSRIRDGERLRVGFYHTLNIYGEQVAACLSEPKVYALLDDQVKRVHALLRPAGYMMSHDEIRVANWCEACQKRKLTPGKMLADNARRCVEMIRAADPQAPIYVWSDMFDPHHNAVDDYYLVNGTWAGAWEGLPKEVTILNWNFDKRHESLAWFAARGHPQIIAGYYDHAPEEIRQWLDAAKATPNVTGVMYTTWRNSYDDLEAFAKAAWGGAPNNDK